MWRLFVAWAQAHMLWHIASRPDADPPGAACPWTPPPRPLEVGDMVVKKTGYQFVGIVVSKFETTTGKTRFVVEHATAIGLLHIFNEEQLQKANGNEINMREVP